MHWPQPNAGQGLCKVLLRVRTLKEIHRFRLAQLCRAQLQPAQQPLGIRLRLLIPAAQSTQPQSASGRAATPAPHSR